MEKKKKIIVIDDEEDFLMFIKLNLERTNKFRVLTFSNVKNILYQVKSFQPDLILLDILMPEIDGLEVCEMLHKDSSVPIIILSALDKDLDKKRAYEAGAIGYICKPVTTNILLSKIEKIISSNPAGGK